MISHTCFSNEKVFVLITRSVGQKSEGRSISVVFTLLKKTSSLFLLIPQAVNNKGAGLRKSLWSFKSASNKKLKISISKPNYLLLTQSKNNKAEPLAWTLEISLLITNLNKDFSLKNRFMFEIQKLIYLFSYENINN